MRYSLLSDCYYLHWDDAVCAPLAKIDGLSHGANVFTGVRRLCDDATGQVSFLSTSLHVCLSISNGTTHCSGCAVGMALVLHICMPPEYYVSVIITALSN